MKLALAILAIATTANAQPRQLPTVRITKQEVTGSGRDKQVVLRVLGRQRNRLQYCYEKHLLVDPEVRGTLKVAFEISPAGKPANVGTMGVEGEVAACTKRVLDYAVFPKPKAGQVVAVKFELLLKP